LTLSPDFETMPIRYSNATFEDNVISNNQADEEGGGLYVGDSSADINGNTIVDNLVDGDGGGISVGQSPSPVTITGNMIVSNHASRGGGLDFSSTNSLMVANNTIMSNTASSGGGGAHGGGMGSGSTLRDNFIAHNSTFGSNYGEGGGIYLYGGSPVIDGNTIFANAARYAGGVYLDSSDSLLEGNSIISNTAGPPWGSGWGGGLFLDRGQPILSNNLIVDNWASGLGSGLYVRGSTPRLVHATISRNGGGDGSGVYVSDLNPNYSTVELTNTIIASQNIGIYVDPGNTASLEATLWGTGAWANGTDWAGDGTIFTGTVNVWGDPAFVDPDAGDYHIAPGSAAIDAGVDAGVTTDIDGEPRPMGTGFDIGADEYVGPGLVLRKSALPNPVETGAPLTYTLRVTNTGTVSLTATISDALPPHVAPGGSLVWTPVPLLPGEGWTETIVVTVEMGYTGSLTNVVQASSEEGATGAYTNTVTVTDVPIAGLVAVNDSPTELGTSTTLMATVTAGTNVTYTWAFGDGNTGSGAVVSHTYPAVGAYAAIVTASNSVSQLTATTSVTITDAPVEGLTAINDSPTELGAATALTATVVAGTHVTYTWAFGDGEVGTGAVVSHTYPAVGVYAAVVTASNSASLLTATTSVTITQSSFHIYLPLVLKNP
jgi:uncharacterized repeat protein (TIGR01451 family)